MKTKIISFSILFFLIASPTKAQEWEFVGLDSMLIKQLYVSGDTIWAGTDARINTVMVSGLYKSTNGGSSWYQLDSELGDGTLVCFYKDPGSNLFYIVKGASEWSLAGTLYKSTDQGKSWEIIQQLVNISINWLDISSFNINEIYALEIIWFPAGSIEYLHRSTDAGETWVELGSFPSDSHGNRVTIALDLLKDSILYAVVGTQLFDDYFYKSTDKGNNWTYISEPPSVEQELTTDPTIPNRIFMFPGYYLTDDGGYSWTIADSCLSNDYSYLSYYVDPFDNTNSYSLRFDGLYKTKNDTICWQLFEGSENLPLNIGSYGFIYEDIGQLRNVFINTLTKEIYVGTAKGIYKKNITTNISQDRTNILSEYILEQNYPNPFNPVTTISYYILERSYVTIKIYDILGKEVITMIDDEKEPGKYYIKFDGTYLTSGIYFYILSAISENNLTTNMVKKMSLIK